MRGFVNGISYEIQAVVNGTNSTRLDLSGQNSPGASESSNSIVIPNFGNQTHLMTSPRVMQSAMRYEP